ncbi:hypothetical protein [Sandaracinus amylolyticus]|uniref:hypothetical protein n=1 Tax=Sandaracinus amylolyticus TaxID=927083 RepID=UPI001F3BA4D8|nr:hypothetical protein [Sandaracinus amylolyticus]UJR79866.1 Hypothetical protein I5071_19050 [Sandaracinus amylolyticus]
MERRFQVNEGVPPGMTLIPRGVWERREQLRESNGDEPAVFVSAAIAGAAHELDRPVSFGEVVDTLARWAGRRGRHDVAARALTPEDLAAIEAIVVRVLETRATRRRRERPDRAETIEVSEHDRAAARAAARRMGLVVRGRAGR